MPVITVSGSLSSGARELAQTLARELGLDYVDHEILVQAARELGVSVSTVAIRDEPPGRLRERLASIMRTLIERSAAAGAADPLVGGGAGLDMILARTYTEAAGLGAEPGADQLSDESYLRVLTSVIKGIAARDNVVILGRGSQAILRREPGVMHVYAAADLDQRIAHLVRAEAMRQPDAEERIKRSDAGRREFHRHYFKLDADDPALYDLSVHTGRIPMPLAVRLVRAVLDERAPRPG